jgi:hypothetical protein
LPGGGAELAGPNPTVVALPFRHRSTGFTKRTAIWRLTRLRVGKFPASFESARRGRASAWPIFDNDLLTEPLRQPLPHNPGYSVSTAARRKPNDPPQRPRWKGLRPCNPRHHWQRGGTRGQMQEKDDASPAAPRRTVSRRVSLRALITRPFRVAPVVNYSREVSGEVMADRCRPTVHLMLPMCSRARSAPHEKLGNAVLRVFRARTSLTRSKKFWQIERIAASLRPLAGMQGTGSGARLLWQSNSSTLTALIACAM